MNRQSVVLVVRQLTSPFVSSDIRILRRHFSVVDYDYRKSDHPALRFLAWALRHRAEFNIVLVWFGDIHATVAITAAFFLRKPSIIVAGGYDVSTLPGHGFLSTPRGRLLARLHFSLCSRILGVSPSVVADLSKVFPEAGRKASVVPTGCDTDFWRPGPAVIRRSVLSVAIAGDWHRVQVKGLDRFAECARLMQHRQFRVVGLSPKMAARLSPLPSNLSWVPSLGPEDLQKEYRSAAVYLQLSRAEGLPNVLMEAMACGCIPVVTPVGGMPDLVRGVGFIVASDELRAAVDAIEQAFGRPELAVECRQRIFQHYTLSRRERELAGAVRALMLPSPPKASAPV